MNEPWTDYVACFAALICIDEISGYFACDRVRILVLLVTVLPRHNPKGE